MRRRHGRGRRRPQDAPAPDAPAEEQKLISNGSVQLKSDDVAEAIFDVRNVVDTYAGEVEANETQTDDDGDPLRARLQLRVPTAQFGEAMQDLEGIAVLVASSGNTKDVTTEVLDTDIRVDVQRRSIERIALLLEQATSIRDVVAIEAQLSQRQADLAVLEKEQRYLEDQTAMATINVSVERTKVKKPAPPAEDDDAGFFAGLEAGWDGLKTFGDRPRDRPRRAAAVDGRRRGHRDPGGPAAAPLPPQGPRRPRPPRPRPRGLAFAGCRHPRTPDSPS